MVEFISVHMGCLLFQALATLASMFAIQWVYALVNILIAAIVYTYIGFSNPGVFPGQDRNCLRLCYNQLDIKVNYLLFYSLPRSVSQQEDMILCTNLTLQDITIHYFNLDQLEIMTFLTVIVNKTWQCVLHGLFHVELSRMIKLNYQMDYALIHCSTAAFCDL